MERFFSEMKQKNAHPEEQDERFESLLKKGKGEVKRHYSLQGEGETTTDTSPSSSSLPSTASSPTAATQEVEGSNAAAKNTAGDEGKSR